MTHQTTFYFPNGPQDHAVRWASPEHLSEGLMNSLSTPTRYAQWRKEAHDYFLVTVCMAPDEHGFYRHAFHLRARTEQTAEKLVGTVEQWQTLDVDRLRAKMLEIALAP